MWRSLLIAIVFVTTLSFAQTKEDVAKIISKLKQENSSTIKASKYNLNQLSKLINEEKIVK